MGRYVYIKNKEKNERVITIGRVDDVLPSFWIQHDNQITKYDINDMLDEIHSRILQIENKISAYSAYSPQSSEDLDKLLDNIDDLIDLLSDFNEKRGMLKLILCMLEDDDLVCLIDN